MINIGKEYEKYTNALIKKGVSPSIVCVGDVIRLLTEDEDELRYNFNTDNIESGPNGELIKINIKKSTIEVYNSIMDNYFSLRVYDMDTGKLFDDGELGKEYTDYYSIKLYGEELFNNIEDKVINDYSDCYRIMNKDKEDINIKMLEMTNKLAHPKLTGLRERVINISKKYCKGDPVITSAVGKIIEQIDEAYYKHSTFKKFFSLEMDEEMVEIINRNIYLQSLKEESETYSKISIFPITELIEEYKAYKVPKTDKLAKKYLLISKKINEALNPFFEYRVDVRNHLFTSKDIDELSKNHTKMLLKRRDELDNINTWSDEE